MHIGLIGGIGPAATDFYYKRLISTFAARQARLDVTIAHADAPTLLHNLAHDNAEAQVAIYMQLTRRLQAAGAECVAVTSIAGHFCINAFKAESPLPVVDMIAEVSRAIKARGLKKLGILGTRTVMETRFYGGIPGTEIISPPGQTLNEVHEAYVAMALAGVITESQRSIFQTASQALIHQHGAEAIMLGGTDLALAFSEHTADLPIVDCAAIHIDAIAKMALS